MLSALRPFRRRAVTSERESSLQQVYSRGQEFGFVSGIGVKALIFNKNPDGRSNSAESGQGHKFSYSAAVYKDIMRGLAVRRASKMDRKSRRC